LRTLVSVALVLALTPSARGATGILALGDFGVGGERERQVGAAVRVFEEANPAELLVTLGDNDYTRGHAFEASWQSSFGWLAPAGVEVAGTLGNHDVRVANGRYELRTLHMPGAYYTRRVGDAQLFVLNSNAVTARQTRWLRNALAASTALWKIAVLHHPPYTCGVYRGHVEVRRAWRPLFERYGVRLVLSGHDHNYQRFAPVRGVTYVVHGGGGAGLYRLGACPRGYPRRVAGRVAHGFLYLEASPESLLVRAVDLNGATVDEFTVRP
jgi:calcineurin-like phosphoesterase family protein